MQISGAAFVLGNSQKTIRQFRLPQTSCEKRVNNADYLSRAIDDTR